MNYLQGHALSVIISAAIVLPQQRCICLHIVQLDSRSKRV